MKTRKTLSKVLAMVLCAMMLMSVIPMSVFAEIENYNKDYQSETHTVFKHTEQTLAPGVTNYTNYAYAKDGKQMVYYVTTADLTRDDVVAQVAYKDMQNDVYGMDKLSNMVACANEKYSDPQNPQFISEYYTVVSACNGDGYNMTTGEPSGVFIMGGNVKKDWNKSSNPVFLAILNDGTAVIDNTQKAWDACKEAGIQEAIDVFGSTLVWDGKDVTANASGSYNTDRHSRTMVGITKDGKLVICVLDGRQEPFSCGGTMHELAQIMLEAGCWRAFNLDGGGSTTFIAKNEGSNECTIQNRPSDGSERSISNGIIIASTAVPSDTFDHVSMIAKDEYVTIGSSTAITVAGVSPAGTAAEIPAEMTYEAVNGTYENGILTATATGDVVLTAKLGDKAVGSVTIHCVVPEAIKFASDTITVPFGKTATLEMIATYGLNEVVTNANNFTFTLENEAAGTISGLSFTACEEVAGVTGTTITAQFVGSELTAEATLSFGKGSEVLFNFEDGTTNGFKTGYGSYNYYLPNSTTFVANANNGKVHSGDYSLGVNIDYTNSQESGFMMTALYRVPVVGEESDRPLVGAQRVGMWVYIPDEYVGLWARWVLYPISSVNEDGTVNIAADSITSNVMDDTAGGTGVVYSFTESGWHYLSCDFSKYAGAMWRDGYYCVQFYISDRDGASYNYYAKENPNINGNFTIYIDDITVDYSTVVEDREAPIFSNVNYATHGMSDAAVLKDGANIGYNTVDFSAVVAENIAKANATGLDASTAKAYVDGNEVACTYKNGSIAMDDSVVLSAGQHTIKFSICDKQGNYASIIRKVNITSGEQVGVKVVPHNAALDRILFGSLYYVDVVATDIASVQSVTTTLNLDSMNKWELDYMEVAEGFEVTYTYDAPDKILYLTITKTGETSLTGEQALVSIPVRVWELKNAGSIIGGSTNVLPENNQYTYAWFKSQNEYWWVAVNVRVQQGAVTLTDGTTDTFTGENVFCDTEAWAMQKFMVETQEGVDYKAAWNGGHIHTAQALEDKAATCTEAGYTGRTYCEVCNSVVDWGTTVPATGHSYEFVDGVLQCTDCGELFTGTWSDGKEYKDGVEALNYILVDGKYYIYENGVQSGVYTGLVDIDGVNYFSKLGVLTSGWFDIDGAWYYFMPETKTAADGSVTTTDGITFDFENGKVLHGVWTKNGPYTNYWYGPDRYRNTSLNLAYLEVEIDGNKYFFNSGASLHYGMVVTHDSNDHVNLRCYDCGTDGIAKPFTGVYQDTLYVNAIRQLAYKLVKVGDDYYFVGDNHAVVRNRSVYLGANAVSAGLNAGYYYFGADGKMELKNGIIDDYYYINGIKAAPYYGLVQWEGNFYYVNDGGKIVRNMRKFVNTTNGLTFENGDPIQRTYFDFDADGKMVLKNGIVGDYYYINGVLVAPYYGLVEWEGNFYYVNDGGKIVKNMRKFVNTTNGLTFANGDAVQRTYYDFDADGKMILN